jgi:hypothetical protein
MPSQAANVILISSTGELGGVWGSTGPSSRKLHGVEEFSVSVTESVEAVPNVGWYGPGPVADEQSQGAEFTISGTWTYQEAPKILNGLFTYTSASTCASTGFIDWHWFAPIASTQICATYPLEFGVSTGFAYKVNGGIINGLKLSGEAGGLWKFETGGLGKNVAAQTTGMSTAAWADNRAMIAVAMKETQLRINPMTTGTWGSSSGLVDATLISFEFNLDAKRHTKLFAGNKYPGGWGDDRYEGTLKLVLEFSSDKSKPLLDSMLGSSGGATSTGVALERIITLWASRDSSAYVSAVNFAGIQSEAIKLWDDRDGNQTLELNMTGKFTTGLMDIGTSGTGNWLTFQICNDSSKSS